MARCRNAHPRLPEGYVSTIKAVSRKQITGHWVPVQSAAARLGVTLTQVRRLMREGRLHIRVIGDPHDWPKNSYTWILNSSLERYAASRYKKNGAQKGRFKT